MERRLEELSALEIGELVNKREITPTEVVKHFYNRISLFNNDINVFAYTKLDEALEQAKNIEKRLDRQDKRFDELDQRLDKIVKLNNLNE